jgi:hypothetical protein
MMSQPCKQEKAIGRLEEFMENTKGLKATIFTISLAILLQVGTFIYLWSGQCTTLSYCVEWIKTEDNIRRIDAKALSVRGTPGESHSGVAR